ncbi:MAG: hypothetical protein K6G30_01155, partial [Acetatifactor sp.]|nr:hypothetical protein [Acetatifactor sp.]
VVTVVPRSNKGMDGSETTRVIISVNPDIEGASDYSLRPFAELIEQMEQLEEQRLFEQTGIHRRNHDRPREQKADSRFWKMPFAATSDPWFISESGDMIDSPRDGSVLDCYDIASIIEHNGCEVKKYHTVVLENENIENAGEASGESVSISRWQEDVSKCIASSRSHVVTWAELDSSLVRRNNQILEAFCMNIVGRPFYDRNEEDFIFPDYRTCIYTDLNCTIILSATYDGGETILKDVLNTDGIKPLESAALVETIKLIDEQRKTLLDIKEQIGKSGSCDRKGIEDLNRRLLAFSAKSQHDEAKMLRNGILKKISGFVRNRFGIDELKQSTKEDLEMLVNESRESLVGRFNKLSALAVPFIIVATVFQMGLIKVEELLSVSSFPYKFIAWGIVGILTFIWIGIMLIPRKNCKSQREIK